MYTVKCFSTLTLSHKEDFFNFLQTTKNSLDPASINMYSRDENGLLHILEKTSRFSDPHGEFHILYFDNKVIGCGGIYISDFCQYIAIAGVRVWITPEHRNNGIIGEYLLPLHKSWAIKKNCKTVALTFNSYNKNLIKVFKRNRLGEKNLRIKNRQPFNLFYKNLYEIPFSVSIKNTEQYVIYEKLDDNFDFDWSLIKFNKPKSRTVFDIYSRPFKEF